MKEVPMAVDIANFVMGRRDRLPGWRPAVAEVQQLQELVRRRHQIEVMLLAEKNRLEATPDTVRCSIERLISMLRAEKASLERALVQQIDSHAQLARNHQLLRTINGIGPLSATVLLAEMAGPDQRQRARHAADRAGLSPRREQTS